MNRFTHEVVPEPAEFGGGWRVLFKFNGHVLSAGVCPPDTEQTDRGLVDHAYAEACREGQLLAAHRGTYQWRSVLMKKQLPTNSRIECAADGWLRRLHLPYYTVAMLRDMRIGDELVLFDYHGPGIFSGVKGNAGASIERVRAGWNFSALWMLGVQPTAGLPSIYTCGAFKLEKGRRISWDASQGPALRSFARVVQRSVRLSRLAKEAGDGNSAARLAPFPMLDSRRGEELEDFEVPFLNRIAASRQPTLPAGADGVLQVGTVDLTAIR